VEENKQNSFSCMILLCKFLRTVSKVPDNIIYGNIDLINAWIHPHRHPPTFCYTLFCVQYYSKEELDFSSLIQVGHHTSCFLVQTLYYSHLMWWIENLIYC
jgi:hypothetical protein